MSAQPLQTQHRMFAQLSTLKYAIYFLKSSKTNDIFRIVHLRI